MVTSALPSGTQAGMTSPFRQLAETSVCNEVVVLVFTVISPVLAAEITLGLTFIVVAFSNVFSVVLLSAVDIPANSYTHSCSSIPLNSKYYTWYSRCTQSVITYSGNSCCIWNCSRRTSTCSNWCINLSNDNLNMPVKLIREETY